MEKLMKTSKTVDKILKVLYWIMIAAGVILLGYMGIFRVAKLAGNPEAEYAVISSVGVGNVELKFAEPQAMEIKHLLAEMLIVTAVGLLVIAVTCYIVRMLRRVLAPMMAGQPFVGTVSRDLKKLGIAVIVGGIAMDIAQAIDNTAIFYMQDVAELFLSDNVSQIMVNNTIDLTSVLVGVLVLMLAHVFRYGEELQQQADETL